ncbi:hypothetical protein LX32DRAFT_241345 [Colletotrichum zoysiae]|uniref:Uncharacterized protein n=1 Tax=Colletotrichum zoysiae TaxID=1216348 RepID=A0AAD9H3C0_9PEZI|nr:hypothetical protein LX32DRAFT_241345 [Colletotrichum zoysiae]
MFLTMPAECFGRRRHEARTRAAAWFPRSGDSSKVTRIPTSLQFRHSATNRRRGPFYRNSSVQPRTCTTYRLGSGLLLSSVVNYLPTYLPDLRSTW